MAKETTIAPASPSSPTVGDMIMHYFNLEGVKHVFGIPGGGLMNFLVDLKNNTDSIEYIICRQETGAAYIADGYYRATGKLGVVVVTTGPGATNALTGVMNAQADGSAMLLLTGEIDQKYFGMGYLQEGIDGGLNINAIFTAATGYSSVVTSGTDAETIIKQAFRDALSIPRQAVHLSLPVNVSIEPLTNAVMSVNTTAYRTNPQGAPVGAVKKAMTSLLACKRPLLFLGNGCRQALTDMSTYNNLLLFVETFGIPVITTADGKGIFPETHKLSLRVYGMADCMWPYAYLTATDVPYDGIMIIGSSLGELSTNSWLPILKPQGPDAPFIQVDINQKIIARSFEVTQGIVGEAGAFINDLAELIPAVKVDTELIEERKQAIATIKKQTPFINPDSYYSNSSPVEPAALMRVLQETIPPDTKIFIDAGNCVGWSVHYLAIQPPASFYTSLAMGPMGFAVGAVVGAKIGCPNQTCLAIVGDGAFLMQGNEISTAKKYQVGAIWIVLFDNNLSMVSQGMDYFAPDNENPDVWKNLYELGNPDLLMYAQSMGAEACKVDSPADLALIMPKVLEQANTKHIPQVIIVDINKNATPPYYNPVYLPKKANK
ncbi:putative acetolactate synthase large subunit IlvB2 [Adhaeribacter aerolatus]|uniref:Putative acetolactate synthase large subunit IlvB2 n=1 Tax=Adhaeribacter aerolatus TaxID=670289 RepID=A0A512B0F0_9BACT|nr:thiamine pyrophosphate-binding protein [Adhaeribacter aerolatus]GEO05438.1 putative acetolactate synthase large subunit IlvB2 [Adhaeribacter aerolatus]